jgi:hypothetical protein
VMVIDPTLISQFTTVKKSDGVEIETAVPQIGLNFACRHCHVEGGFGSVMTDEVLIQAATSYHTPPSP